MSTRPIHLGSVSGKYLTPVHRPPGSNVLPIKLVIATALMAIARKVIVLDITETEAVYVYAIGVVTLALGATYWLVGNADRSGARGAH